MVVRLDGAQLPQVELVGGKAHSLARLAQLGVNVPRASAITTELFKQFVAEHGIREVVNAKITELSMTNTAQIAQTSREIIELIQQEYPKFAPALDVALNIPQIASKYAVRSSATDEDGKERAWAGQLKSLLDVEHQGIHAAVLEVWSSLFSPSAITYRLFYGLQHKKISVGVIVQEFINTDYAGVIFSANPVTNNRNEMVLEYVAGLGEALVSGAATPARYAYTKDTKQLSMLKELKDTAETIDRGISSGVLQQLCDVVTKIEAEWQQPIDVEWGVIGDNLYILQVRPITTIK
jgi:phosphoenolpyruvate synthase/pyruvate phosphate dikinase